jgi:hypothetical protein
MPKAPAATAAGQLRKIGRGRPECTTNYLTPTLLVGQPVLAPSGEAATIDGSVKLRKNGSVADTIVLLRCLSKEAEITAIASDQSRFRRPRHSRRP